MNEQFWIDLNQLFRGYSLPLIKEGDEKALLTLIRNQIEERDIFASIEKNSQLSLAKQKTRMTINIKTTEMFLFFIKECLVAPRDITLSHRDKDAINQLIVAKIDQFIENVCISTILDDEY